MSRNIDDLIWDILLKLPAESIYRFRTVCKSWLKLIESSSFIKAQVKKTVRIHTIDNNLIVVPGSDEDNTLYSVVFPSPENLNAASLKKLDHPVSDGKNRVNLVGSCNGLICLENTGIPLNYCRNNFDYPKTDTISFILWNPSTGVYHIVTDKSNISASLWGGRRIYSYCYFGYDHVKDDYHIVRVTMPPDATLILDFYGLKNDSMTKIHHNQEFFPKRKDRNYGVFVSGTLYLLLQKANTALAIIQYTIIAFDISTQSFRSVELPSINHNLEYILGDLHGRLSVIECAPTRKHVIWFMTNDEEGGINETLWKTIEIETSKPFFFEKLLSYSSPDAEQVLLFEDDMILCDLKTKSTKIISLQSPFEFLEESKACVCLSTIASPFIV